MNKTTNIQNLELSKIENILESGKILAAILQLDTFESTSITDSSVSLRHRISKRILDTFNPILIESKYKEIAELIYPRIDKYLPDGLFYDCEKAFSLYDSFYYFSITELALYFLTRAANLNHNEAQARLAEYYYKGIYIEKDDNLAFEYMKKASDSDNALAINNLGYFYYEGIGTTINYKLAFEHLYKAYQMGETCSLNELGHMLYTGKGTIQNIDLAIEIWNKGKDLGDEDCSQSLSRYIYF